MQRGEELREIRNKWEGKRIWPNIKTAFKFKTILFITMVVITEEYGGGKLTYIIQKLLGQSSRRAHNQSSIFLTNKEVVLNKVIKQCFLLLILVQEHIMQ